MSHYDVNKQQREDYHQNNTGNHDNFGDVELVIFEARISSFVTHRRMNWVHKRVNDHTFFQLRGLKVLGGRGLINRG